MQTLRLSICVILLVILIVSVGNSQSNFTVTAYYYGGPEKVDSIAAEKLTHIIFSFCHLKGNVLHVDNSRDAATITNLVALKSGTPHLRFYFHLVAGVDVRPVQMCFPPKKEGGNFLSRSCNSTGFLNRMVLTWIGSILPSVDIPDINLCQKTNRILLHW